MLRKLVQQVLRLSSQSSKGFHREAHEVRDGWQEGANVCVCFLGFTLGGYRSWHDVAALLDDGASCGGVAERGVDQLRFPHLMVGGHGDSARRQEGVHSPDLVRSSGPIE